jgi:hypothetical protein
LGEIGREFTVRIKDEAALQRVLTFCDVHGVNLDVQGLVDRIVTGTIVVLPLRGVRDRGNALRIHKCLATIITDLYPTLSKLVTRIKESYELANELAEKG